MPFFWGLWDKGFNWDGLQRFIAGYQPPTKHCARQERDLRAFAKKAGYKIVGGLEGDRFRKKRYRTRLGKSSGPQHFGDS